MELPTFAYGLRSIVTAGVGCLAGLRKVESTGHLASRSAELQLTGQISERPMNRLPIGALTPPTLQNSLAGTE